MSKNQFAAICAEHLIEPGVALENVNVVRAVKENDEAALRSVLREEF